MTSIVTAAVSDEVYSLRVTEVENVGIIVHIGVLTVLCKPDTMKVTQETIKIWFIGPSVHSESRTLPPHD